MMEYYLHPYIRIECMGIDFKDILSYIRDGVLREIKGGSVAKRIEWTHDSPGVYASLFDAIGISKNIDELIYAIHPSIDPSYFKFFLSNAYHATNAPHSHIMRSTINNILKWGHTDSNIMIFVNPFQKNGYYDKKTRVTTQVPSHMTENFVLELDSVPDCDSEAKLREIMRLREVPQPRVVVKTSPFSFHCLYIGKPNTFLHFNNRLKIAKKFAQIDCEVVNEQVLAMKLKAAGVDYGHLKSNILNHKIRVPGTINSKHSRGSYVVTCSGCFGGSVHVVPTLTNSERKELQDYPFFVQKRIVLMTDHFRMLNYTEEDSVLQGEIIGSQWSALRNTGRAKIYQNHWASVTGLAQTSISRKITKLMKLGYLQTAKEYVWEKSPRLYRAGPTLLALMEQYEAPVARREYSLSEPYLDGLVYRHFLSDVRALWERGHDGQYVVNFIMEKQRFRERSKQRSGREIRRVYDQWCLKMAQRGRKPSKLNDVSA